MNCNSGVLTYSHYKDMVLRRSYVYQCFVNVLPLFLICFLTNKEVDSVNNSSCQCILF